MEFVCVLLPYSQTDNTIDASANSSHVLHEGGPLHFMIWECNRVTCMARIRVLIKLTKNLNLGALLFRDPTYDKLQA